jgi:cyclophilin family peptidyl-prolyl cis-trans isomerase
MKAFFVALILTLVASLTMAQEYKPKAGETVLRVAVEGRGNIFIKLHTKEAPNTTSQIIRLARSGFYNGQRFFRVEKSPRPFLAQIGDPKSKSGDIDDASLGSGGSGSRVAYEDSGYPNVAGAVGLSALPNDKNSGDSQFYMLMATSRFLDGSYTVFGQIVQGMDVLRTIEKGDRVSGVSVLNG